MSQIHDDYYEFYFKLIYTCQTKKYLVNPDMTIEKFLEDVKNKIKTDFGFNENEIIEIVKAGQFDNVNGYDAELAPEIEPSCLTVRRVFRHKPSSSFYIRKKINII